jgi:hypothetical protein
VLKEAEAKAQMQTQLSNSLVQISIAENEAEAQLVRARKQAEQVVVTAQAESQQRVLAGKGEGARILQEGLSEASVLLRKISSFSDPRLYALSIMAQNLANCTQPLVPERVFIAGGAGGTGASGDASLAGGSAAAGSGLLGLLLSLMVAEKTGFQLAEHPAESELRAFTEQVSRQAMDSIQQAVSGGSEPTVRPGNGPITAPVTKPSSASRLDGLESRSEVT